MTEDWEYEEEALQVEIEREKQKRYDYMPELCRRCRWLEWYYMEECSHQRWLQGGRCALFSRHLPYFRPHLLCLWILHAQYRWWQLRNWSYLYHWKRSYRSLRWSPHFHHLRLYLHGLKVSRQVKAWLRANGPERTAGYCMWHLNRCARNNGRKKHLIYQFKNHLVRIFYEHGLCIQVSQQVQRMECWECNGSGEDWHDEPCWKCGGTGTYREHVLYRFVFEVGSRTYVWHQPNGLVTFQVPAVDLGGVYQVTNGGSGWLTPEVHELYMMTVWEYLRKHGVSGDEVGLQFLSLRSAVRADWLNSKARRKWHQWTQKVRRTLENIKRSQIFISTGSMPEIDDRDEIPF